MLFRSLGLGATLALTANALLLPPNFSGASIQDLPEEYTKDSRDVMVRLPCAECSIKTTSGTGAPTEEDSALVVYFDVGSNRDALHINHVQFYPPSPNTILDELYTYTVPFEVDTDEIHTYIGDHDIARSRITGYTFHFDFASTISEAGFELLPMVFSVTSVDGVTVSPPEMIVNLIKDANGALAIASVETRPVNPPHKDSPKDHPISDKECGSMPALLCKWKSILADKLNSIKSVPKVGCHGSMAGRFRPSHHPHPPRPDIEEAEEGSVPDHVHHHGHGEGAHAHGPHHHRHGSKLHAFLHSATRVFFTVFIPVVVGVAAGMATYLVGMLIGCTIAFVIARIRGEHRGGYALVDAEERGEEEWVNEKEALKQQEFVAEAEAPPAYEEKEVVIVEEEQERRE